MKKRFVPRAAVNKVDHTAQMYPLTVRSYRDYVASAVPGDTIWFSDLKPVELHSVNWLGESGKYRLIGTRLGEPVDLVRDGGEKITIQAKATHVVRLPGGGDRLYSARRWYRLGSMLNENELMVVNDNEKNCRYLNVGNQIEIVKEIE